MSSVVLRGGRILTLDPARPELEGDVVSVDGALTQVGGSAEIPAGAEVLDARGCVVMPGLVQTHIHTCQTLARGRADDLALLDWLERVVWPYEAALSAEDVACAARLATAELLLGGTTAIQDMGTVHHEAAALEVLAGSGIRALAGKAMMDAGERVPKGLRETTEASMSESVALCREWQGAANGRLGYAFAPRFVLSCSEGLLRETVAEARRLGARIHTHASENRDELAAVRRERGDDNVAYLDAVGMTGPDVGLAHCVWLTAAEKDILARTRTRLLHCPSSNLKLASGVAEIPELVAAGVQVSIGADGAPCNNNLDGFLELRLAALLHKPRCGPKAVPAGDALALATRAGAEALGLSGVGVLTPGNRADVIAVEVDTPHAAPTASAASAVVYACRSADVRHVVVDGVPRVRGKELLGVDLSALVADARTRAHRIFAGL
jgi:5-methylthioadenosine/S-adenosylhomocysteine deaminase